MIHRERTLNRILAVITILIATAGFLLFVAQVALYVIFSQIPIPPR